MNRSPSRDKKSLVAPSDFAKLERLLEQAPPADRVCAELAKILRVQQNEVALLRIEDGMLKFLVPAELRTAGSIPLSSSAVAARTAATRTAVFFNNFVTVKHASLFEAVKLGDSESRESSAPAPIQKIMSTPVLTPEGKALGVIQVSRKGVDSTAAGPDFTVKDLQQLEQAADIVSRFGFMQPASQTRAPQRQAKE